MLTAHFRDFTTLNSDLFVDKSMLIVVDTFQDMATLNSIFVDKSMLIKEILDTRCKVFLITRPHRWGKSLNLNMLETFFQADVNQETGVVNFEKQSKKHLFENLLIAKENIDFGLLTGEYVGKKIIDLQGKYPVIKLTITGDQIITSEEKLVQIFAMSLKLAFKKHQYILNSNKKMFLASECELMSKYLYDYDKITIDDIGLSLRYLIEALYEHYNTKVVLLIDEYDKILTDLVSKKSPYFEDAVEILRNIISPIKNNEKLLFTVFSGITRLEKANIFSGLNQLYHDSVADSIFSKSFGFTETEIDVLLEKLIELKPKLSAKKIKNSITKWYNGYKIGNQTIYNPWSIMNCFHKISINLPDPYKQHWIETDSTKLIEEAIINVPTTDKIEELIKYGETEVDYKAPFTFEDIKTNEKSLILLLLHSGYTTISKNGFCRIPNYEVQSYFFYNFVTTWLERRIPQSSIPLILINFEDTKKYVDEFLDRLVYGKYPESYFQTLVAIPFSFKSITQSKYRIHVAKQTEANTKIDILLTPKKGDSKSVFLLELKIVDTPENMTIEMNQILFQVFNKKYAENVLKNAELPENKHWENFCIRIIVFSRNYSESKWTVDISELVFSKEKLQITCKTFEETKNEAKESIIDHLLTSADSNSEYPSIT
ncbi:hypothetical protein SteCoe_26912 [Stentor coeruleus]|uniref:AAA-ATPase-like domain-containing protein n=1 Tax=Stentor coeruleus TaxID=5963 RepID=A0A1R2BBT0_9CILI|nr:hypothetical protein SteCoe_26912 [Stentor coeruleus]